MPAFMNNNEDIAPKTGIWGRAPEDIRSIIIQFAISAAGIHELAEKESQGQGRNILDFCYNYPYKRASELTKISIEWGLEVRKARFYNVVISSAVHLPNLTKWACQNAYIGRLPCNSLVKRIDVAFRDGAEDAAERIRVLCEQVGPVAYENYDILIL